MTRSVTLCNYNSSGTGITFNMITMLIRGHRGTGLITAGTVYQLRSAALCMLLNLYQTGTKTGQTALSCCCSYLDQALQDVVLHTPQSSQSTTLSENNCRLSFFPAGSSPWSSMLWFRTMGQCKLSNSTFWHWLWKNKLLFISSNEIFFIASPAFLSKGQVSRNMANKLHINRYF